MIRFAFSWQLLIHPTPPLSPPPVTPEILTEWSLEPGETKMAPPPDNGALVQLQIASILQERGLFFQFHGSLTSGLFTCDKKKVLYSEQKGSVYKPQ